MQKKMKLGSFIMLHGALDWEFSIGKKHGEFACIRFGFNCWIVAFTCPGLTFQYSEGLDDVFWPHAKY